MSTPAPSPSGIPGSSRARTAAIVAVLVVVAVLVAVLLVLRHHGDGTPAATPPAATTSSGTPTPYRLVVKSANIDAPVVSIAMTKDRALDPPANPREVGWWNASAKPGASTGQTIVTGHTVHTGGGQFDHLGSIKKGAAVQLTTPQGQASYVVTKVFTLSKHDVAVRTAELFGQARKHNRLVLITCGNWTGTEYLTNVFVYAKPVTPASAT